MGLSLIWLSHVLGQRGVFSSRPRSPLRSAGVLAMVWQVPGDLIDVPPNLELPFEVVEVQFFASISICHDALRSRHVRRSGADAGVGRGDARSSGGRAGACRRRSADGCGGGVVATTRSSARTSTATIMSWNPAAEQLYGFIVEEMVGQQTDLDHHRTRTSRKFDETVESGPLGRGHPELRHRSAATRTAAGRRLVDAQPDQGRVRAASSASRRSLETYASARRSEELRRLALLDELTGLNNRRGFMSAGRSPGERRKSGQETDDPALHRPRQPQDDQRQLRSHGRATERSRCCRRSQGDIQGVGHRRPSRWRRVLRPDDVGRAESGYSIRPSLG